MELKIHIIEWLTDVISVRPPGDEHFDPVRYIERIPQQENKPTGHMMRQPITCRRNFYFHSSNGDFVILRNWMKLDLVNG